ncbi:MAG: hypothetical protein K1Y36_25685 [Blastocatellia bacterium]|nr:hypothetical protein [Blastocatellia bacterium]
MMTSILFFFLLERWVWASLTGVAALLGLIFAFMALRRAAQGAKRLAEDIESSSQQSPLSLFETALPTQPASTPVETEPLPPTELAPLPVKQVPALTIPEPLPTEPLEAGPIVVAQATAKIESASPAVIHTANFALNEAETMDAEAYSTEENTIEPEPPRTSENILASQIAQQIAERRAKLSASETMTSENRLTEGVKINSAVETQPMAEPHLRVALQTTPIKPDTGRPAEHLPTSKKRLQPPSAALTAPATAANFNAASAPPPLVRAKGTAPLSVSELLPTQAQTAPVHPGTVQTPVEYFPKPVGEASQSNIKTPSFLGVDVVPEKGDISYERRGALKLIAGVAVAATLAVFTFLPAARTKLPAPLAAQLQKIPVKLGIETLPPPPPPPKLVEVREYVVTYKPTQSKEVRTALMGGVVKNISPNPLQNLRVEVELWRRDAPAQPPESRIVPLDTTSVAPGAQGKYVLEVPDKDYFSARFVRVLQADGKEANMVYNKEKIPAWEPAQNAVAAKPEKRQG